MKRFFLAAAALACLSVAAHADPIRLCTGSSSAVYYDAGQTIASMARPLQVEVIETGGTIDNLAKTLDDNTCDAMIGQPDGPVFMARQSPAKVKKLRQVASLHREYLHVLCTKNSDVDDLYDLIGGDKGKLAVGEPGSGAWLIWQNITKEAPDFAPIPISNESGILALSAVSSGDVACMIAPNGLNTGTLKEADATFSDTVKLVGANYRKFDNAVGLDGKPLYTYSDIPGKTYPNLQSGWFSTSVSTISWNAAVFINTDRFPDNKQLQAFVTAVNRAAIGIKAEYGK